MKTKLQARAKEIVAVLYNDPTFTGDKWSLSMELSNIQRQLGAIGADAAHAGAESEDECE